MPDNPMHKRGAREWRWTIAEGTAHGVPPALLDDPDTFLLHNPSQKPLKESPVRTAFIISGPKGDLFLKQYKMRGFKEVLKYLVVPSKAREGVADGTSGTGSGNPDPPAFGHG